MPRKPASITLAKTALLALIALCPPALAQDTTGPNLDTTAKGTPGAASRLAMAHQLYTIGMANKDPLTVLAAARLTASVSAIPGPALKKETRTADGGVAGDVADGATGDAPAHPFDATPMLAAAKTLAAEDDTLLSLIESAEAERPQIQTTPAIRHPSRLSSGMTDVWQVPFFGNSYAELAVIGDGTSNLDVTVTDEGGNILCLDLSWSDKAICDFVPAWNGYFYITVQNTGTTANSYELLTN